MDRRPEDVVKAILARYAQLSPDGRIVRCSATNKVIYDSEWSTEATARELKAAGLQQYVYRCHYSVRLHWHLSSLGPCEPL